MARLVQFNKMKIVYCLNSIQEIGGISSAILNKAKGLADLGHDIYIVVTDHNKDVKNKISDKIIIKNLEINYYKDDWKSYFYVLKGIIVKRKIHKKLLKHFLIKLQPDIVISVGQSEKYFLPTIKGNWKTLREFHYEKLYRMREKSSIISKVISKIINFYEFKFKLKQYDKVVVLTDIDKRLNWNNSSMIEVIPNPLPQRKIESAKLENKKVIAIGRLVKVKNFSSLIKAFDLVVKKHPSWTLDIYGEGELKDLLIKEVRELKLHDKIFFKGNNQNVTELLKDYSIFVMSSIYEGLPMAMLEAMASGLPIVAYDCPYGPRQLIKDGENGFLVDLNDEYMMAKKICQLIEDPYKLKSFGEKSKIKSEEYNCENICNKWVVLFKKILNN